MVFYQFMEKNSGESRADRIAETLSRWGNKAYLVTVSVLLIASSVHIFSEGIFDDKISRVKVNAERLNHSPQNGEFVYDVNLDGRQYQVGFLTSSSFGNFWYSQGDSSVEMNLNVLCPDNVRISSGG